jgi:PAP2 superfamily
MNVTDLNPAARALRPMTMTTAVEPAIRLRRSGVSIALTAARRRSAAVRWGRELALITLLYGGYMAGRAAIGVHTGAALHRGQQILDLEAITGMDVERPLNALVMAVPPVALLFAYLYATLHYVVTPAALVWIALRRSAGYRQARNGLLIATAIGLLGYWLLPTAPPRLLDAGFTDVMAAFSGVGWWGDAASAPRGMEALSNQFAAFPSLHVGWAMWVALVLHANTRNRTVRGWVFAYPALMTLVVMATANHYLLDALGGIACAALGHWLAGCWEARPRAIRAPATVIERWAEQHQACLASCCAA